MKKRLEDRLIELAFEERNEAGVAELTTSPLAAARLKEYRAMRSALGQLRELPEHQLSTERLREALLHQGLKRRRAFPWQALGYLSAASSLFVCAFFVSRDIRRTNAPAPQVHGDTAFKVDPAEAKLPRYLFGPNVSAGPAEAAASKVSLTGEHRLVARRHGLHTPDLAVNSGTKSALTFADLRKPAGGKGGSESLVFNRVTDLVTLSPKTPAPARPASVSNAMLLIQSNTDADSGLDTAQEVSANGDVLVSG